MCRIKIAGEDDDDDDDDDQENDGEVDQSDNMANNLTNEQIHKYSKSTPMKDFVETQQLKWFAHIVRSPNSKYIKKLTFVESKSKRKGRPIKTVERTIYQRLKEYDSLQILKSCFRWQNFK